MYNNSKISTDSLRNEVHTFHSYPRRSSQLNYDTGYGASSPLQMKRKKVDNSEDQENNTKNENNSYQQEII